MRFFLSGSSSSRAPAAAMFNSLSPSRQDESLFAERQRRDHRLRAYIESSKEKYQEACVTNMTQPRCAQVMKTIAQKCDKISALDRNALKKYHTLYGCTKITCAAIELIKKRGRSIVEQGAGNGHWQAALMKAGITIRSFDNKSDLPVRGLLVQGSNVENGSIEKLKQWSRHRFDLLLVYPPPTSQFAFECARAYRGDCLLYVGEPRGGANANEAFFDYVESHFTLSSVLDLEPFPGGCERLYVLNRRRRDE